MPWQDDEWTAHYKNRFKQAEEARKQRQARDRAWTTPDKVKLAVTVAFAVAATAGVLSVLSNT